MRTTLNIDDDILAAAKALAAEQRKSTGEIISMLTRQSLRSALSSARLRNGVSLLPVQVNATPVVTQELISQLRDDDLICPNDFSLMIRDGSRALHLID